MTVKVDGMGTMFARREGTDPSLPPVVIGSHLDTQPTGGRYDGVLGVLGALEVVRTLNDLGIKTKYPIEVVNWTNEEGTAVRARHARLGRLRRRDRSGLCLQPHRREGPEVRRRTGADRLQGHRAGRRAEAPGAVRAPYRAGADPRGRGQGHRRRHPRPGAPLDPVHRHRQGEPYRLDADGDAQECRARPGPDHRARPRDRHGPPAERGGRHRPCRRLPEQPQHHPRQGRLHHRLPRAISSIRSTQWSPSWGEKAPKICAALGLGFESEIVGAVRPAGLRQGLRQGGARRRRAARLLAPRHRLRRRPRRLLDQPGGADGDGDVPLRRRPVSHNEDENISKEWATAGANVLFQAAVETAEIVE